MARPRRRRRAGRGSAARAQGRRRRACRPAARHTWRSDGHGAARVLPATLTEGCSRLREARSRASTADAGGRAPRRGAGRRQRGPWAHSARGSPTASAPRRARHRPPPWARPAAPSPAPLPNNKRFAAPILLADAGPSRDASGEVLGIPSRERGTGQRAIGWGVRQLQCQCLSGSRQRWPWSSRWWLPSAPTQ